MGAQMKISEAQRWTGKSRSTLLRDIKKGKVSAAKDEEGSWKIDSSELARVYQLKAPPPEAREQVGVVSDMGHEQVGGAPRTGQMTRGEHPPVHELTAENAGLRAELEVTKQLAEDRQGTIDDLRVRLDTSEKERRSAQEKVTALLSDMRPEAARRSAERPRTRVGFWIALALALGAVAAFVALLYVPELFRSVN